MKNEPLINMFDERFVFFVRVNTVSAVSFFLQLIEEQGKDSCGESGTDETPQEHKRRGGSAPARGKRSLARKSTGVS
ncbi:hypothetical protein [Priestia aryabhattai]|uniref:hypothetical protein n=1 Tax=Priestia aryabhattai TaxID=412384 RepID=UPI003D269ECA